MRSAPRPPPPCVPALSAYAQSCGLRPRPRRLLALPRGRQELVETTARGPELERRRRPPPPPSERVCSRGCFRRGRAWRWRPRRRAGRPAGFWLRGFRSSPTRIGVFHGIVRLRLVLWSSALGIPGAARRQPKLASARPPSITDPRQAAAKQQQQQQPTNPRAGLGHKRFEGGGDARPSSRQDSSEAAGSRCLARARRSRLRPRLAAPGALRRPLECCRRQRLVGKAARLLGLGSDEGNDWTCARKRR